MENIKSVVLWKTQFYKNISKEGGALKYAISKCLTNNIVIHSETQKNGRAWGHTTPLKYLDLLNTNKGLYEVITNYPHKLYFDIDKKVDADTNTETFLSEIKNIILEFFPNFDFAISGSITDSKISYHIVSNNYIIENEQQRNIIKYTTKYMNENRNKAFDWKVYTNNRNMKSINQSKRQDERIQTIIEDDDKRHHQITAFITNHALPLPETNYEINEIAMIDNAKKTFNLGDMPIIHLVEPENFDFATALPIHILQLFPVNSGFNHNYTHLIARYCFYNNITFETFIGWIRNKHTIMTDEILQRLRKNWDRLNRFPEVSNYQIKAILSKFYPHITKDNSFKNFLNTFEIEKIQNVNIKKIDRIEPNHFTSDKVICFNTGMGSGKTTQTINFLKTIENFKWISPNKALAHNTMHRLKEEHIDVKHYLDYKTKDKKNGVLNDLDKLIVVINSIHYIDTSLSNNGVIIIDEVETLLDKFLGSFMQNKIVVWNNFITLLRNATQIILLDAFITTKTLNFFKNILNDSINIYERINEPTTRKVNYIECPKGEKSDYAKKTTTMLYDIITKLKTGKKVFIFYPYKLSNCKVHSMAEIHKMLTDETGKNGEFYNADVDDTKKITLKDVNTNWRDLDFIITNNIITCGVNYDIPNDFDEAYIFMASFNSPRDIIQVSYRVRDLTSNTINICFMDMKMTPPTTHENDTKKINCPIYTNLYNNILTEKYAPIKKAVYQFCNKAKYTQTTEERVINAELDKYVNKLLDDANCSMSYESIPAIDNATSVLLQQKMFSQSASMMDKFMLKKYFFKLNFTNEVDDNDLLFLWEHKYTYVVERMKKMYQNPNNIFTKIQQFNKWKYIIPTSSDEFNNVKLTTELIDEIFNNFKLKNLTRTSSKKSIIKDIYNSYFSKIIITSKYDDSKNMTYDIIDDADDALWIITDFIIKPNYEECESDTLDELCDGLDIL